MELINKNERAHIKKHRYFILFFCVLYCIAVILMIIHADSPNLYKYYCEDEYGINLCINYSIHNLAEKKGIKTPHLY